MKCSIRASHPKKNVTVTYFVLIKAQIELSWTVQDLFSIHTHFFRIGLESDLYIHMYTISQNLKEAFVWLFHQCSRGEVVSFLERNDQRIWVYR